MISNDVIKVIEKAVSRIDELLYAGYYRLLRYQLSHAIQVRFARSVYRWRNARDLSVAEFECRDENWPTIKYIAQLLYCRRRFCDAAMQAVGTGNHGQCQLYVCENKITVDRCEKIKARWVFLRYREALPENYAVEYDLTLFSEFTEVQFAFNYVSLAKRFRFMLLNNNRLSFEIVDKGAFFSSLRTVPLNFRLGYKYRIRVEICGSEFSYFINDICQMCVDCSVLINETSGTTFALIFYEAGDARAIRFSLERIRFLYD